MKKQKLLLNILIILFLPLLFTACPDVSFYENQLKVPENLKVSSITSNSATISWTPVKQAVSYEVSWFKGNSDTGGYKQTWEASVVLDELDYDESYKVLVRAMPADNDNDTIPSAYVQTTFKTKEDEAPAGEYARPHNIKLVLDDTKKKITVSWDSVEGAVYYDVVLEYTQKYDYRPDESFVIMYTVSATQTTSITVPNRKLGQLVNCKIAARNSHFSDTCRWSKPVALKL